MNGNNLRNKIMRNKKLIYGVQIYEKQHVSFQKSKLFFNFLYFEQHFYRQIKIVFRISLTVTRRHYS